MGLFRELGKRAERFKKQVEDAAHETARYECGECGKRLHADLDECPECGSTDIQPREVSADEDSAETPSAEDSS